MLYGRHLGLKGGVVRQLAAAYEQRADAKLKRELAISEPKAFGIWEAVESIKEEYRDTDVLKPSAVYRYFKADSKGNQLSLYEASGALAATFEFPRERKENGLCLVDFANPETLRSETPDNVCMFVVSVGRGVRQLSESLKNRGDYLASHILQALALESAEAYAEMLHSQIRKSWGFGDSTELTMMERFQAKYRGKRYSFGYPACPRLDDQALLFKLLNPSEIGIQLTEGFMMDPEASVSALVFQHPQATYFSVGSSGEANDPNRS
jgi:5-methyltetrahydrofolate--homocysteine methyltransferase